MNAAAFKRGEAITRLENYAPVIVEHLALVTWFPNNSAATHWKIELDAFTRALKRYNTPKGKKGNFTKEIIVDALNAMIETSEDKDYVVIGAESHGVTLTDDPDWSLLPKAFEDFAANILNHN